MELREWALVIFTVVMQMAVGAFVILGGVHFFAARRYKSQDADLLSDRALLAIGPLAVFALIVTFFHLGNPINAPRAIMNFGSSWLSREIGLAVAFSVLGAVFAFLQWRKILTPTIRNGLALLTAVVGLVLVYAMANIYRLPTIPAWDTAATPIIFFITSFLLGALAISAAFAASFWYLKRKASGDKKVQYDILATTLRWIAIISIALMGIQFIVIPIYFAQLATFGSAAATASLNIIVGQHPIVLALELILLFVGAGLVAMFIYQTAAIEKHVQRLSALAYLAFALVLVAEVMGRFLFYVSMVKIGL